MDRIRGSLLANEWLIFSGCILVIGMVFGYANVQGYLQSGIMNGSVFRLLPR